MDDVLSDKHFVCHLYDLVFSVSIEDYYIINIRAVAYKFIFLQTGSHETFLTVDIEFLVSLDNLCRLNGVKVLNFRQSRMHGSVFLFQIDEPVCRNLHHIVQVTVYIFYLCLYLSHQLISLILIEFKNTLHLYLHESENIIFRHLSDHLRIEWCESFIDMLTCSIHIRSVLKAFVFVYSLFDKYLFERCKVQLFQKFPFAYLKFLLYKSFRAVNGMAQHIAHRKELRFVIFYNATIRRDVHLAV